MKNFKISSSKTDLYLEKKEIINNIKPNIDIYIKENINKNKIYKTIFFNDYNNDRFTKVLEKEILYFFNEMKITNKDHIFIIGIGNDNYIADSIGPKTLKYIKVNSYLENIGININGNKVSSLEPGVLGETGILTEKIVKSVSKEIKPDLIIIIDSFVSNDINSLNSTIEINNYGIDSGSGIKNLSSDINSKTLGTKVLAIGVTTSVELTFSNEKDKKLNSYLLSTKDIDIFINDMSSIIGKTINKVIYNLM